ncbi:hypothetical protein RUM43_008643, partial [Polyplax serrata]
FNPYDAFANTKETQPDTFRWVSSMTSTLKFSVSGSPEQFDFTLDGIKPPLKWAGRQRGV